MNILLVGCTGFLGKSLIHYLITHTRHNIILVLRPKHSLSIDERLQDILNEMDITDVERINLINVCYDEMRKICSSVHGLVRAPSDLICMTSATFLFSCIS